MATIDADAHVVETPATWDFMDAADAAYKPVRIQLPGENRGRWVIDGKLRGFAQATVTSGAFAAEAKATGRAMEVSQESQNMENVEVRVHHMDELGIDIQVLYPTIYINEITDKPEVDVAICNGYNRWLADIWRQGQGRLRWVCPLPYHSMRDALDMLPWCKEHGAVAVLMRAIEGTRLIQDPYFDPLYDLMTKLDMPMAMHVGTGNQAWSDMVRQRGAAGFWSSLFPVVGACHTVIATGLPVRFPKLRWGFIEAAASWVPWIIKDLRRRSAGKLLPENLFEAYRIYVTCYTSDDIEYVAKYAGESSLMIGTDYGHNDQSSELEAFRRLRGEGLVPASLAKKIVDDNPRRFYGL